ncbi:MAG: hypothetical protein ACXVZN_09000 [Gaiellaceae bacterium]
MRRARIGVVAVLVVLLAGCGGGGGHPRRDAVDAYFAHVDSAEAPLLNRRVAIENALRTFSMSTNPPAEVKALKQAQTEILAAERRVAAIEPPADARKIHAGLLALLRLEASLTGDLLLTTSYAPALKQALAPATPAGTALAKELRTAKGWNAQADAFARYAATLRPVVARLDTLRAPPVLRPTLVGERAALRRRVELSNQVAAALRKKDTKSANTAIGSLFAIGSDAVRTRNAEIAAAHAYNARITRVSILTAAIAKERQRLIRSIG